jgi:hypothetical protein
MTEIAYKDEDRVPSWSWMTYSGGIEFMKIRFGDIDWNDDLKFDKERKHALVTNLGDFSECTIKPGRKRGREQSRKPHAVLTSSGRREGWIQYDVQDGEDISGEQCVVVGRVCKKKGGKYYVLVVRPTDMDSEYRRVGVGLISSKCVLRREANVRVV